ncbi:MAG: serine/threonine protein kinase [Kiritimatiellae bacterium]|nr:serine/threonine protein kinase [Kiritimatiellia bacterium]MDW8457971.1 serine/threonine-protein kinase [Verrucomicrobiota bacterium]
MDPDEENERMVPIHEAETAVDSFVLHAETRPETSSAPGAEPTQPMAQPSGKGMSQLVSNYRAIVQARAIYYPVAYRFTKELGRGRQGIVFLGLRQGARGCITRHAIKVFDPGIYPNAKKYWTDMGRIAAQTSKLQLVKSPNLVAPDIYEEYNGIGYVQMERVDGVGLRYLLDGQHLARARRNSTDQEWNTFTDVIFRLERNRIAIQPGVAIYIMRRVLRGLETLHDLGFVHCDVKPSNIMIDRLGYVKLIDYGRANTVNEKLSFLLGTPLFMAPEMHRRETALPQSDIYAVGLVGLEMLRGQPLLDATTTSEADMLNYKMSLCDRLPDLLPEYVRRNAEFVDVMRRFLNPDPRKRFATAQEAESGPRGLILVHKQLALAGQDTEYGRELEGYLAKLVDPRTGQVETEETMAVPGET